jgi:hypothetical protein
VRDHVLHPYKTTGKIIALHGLILKSFNSEREKVISIAWEEAFPELKPLFHT